MHPTAGESKRFKWVVQLLASVEGRNTGHHRFAVLMDRSWGLLWKLIDLQMKLNCNNHPPFSDEMAGMTIINRIAKGMEGLHKYNIVHRDLKASNALVSPMTHILEQCELDLANPEFSVYVGD